MFAQNYFTTKSIHSLGARFNDNDGGEDNQETSIDFTNLSEEQLNHAMQPDGASSFASSQAENIANEKVGKLESSIRIF